MYEKYQILQNPPDQNLLNKLKSVNDVNRIALTVCQDTILTYCKVTLSQNPLKDNNGYDLTKAPIIGLLTRITKLLKLISKFYEMGKADNLSIYTRSLIESATIAVYLIQNGDEAIKDFRLCSYKHTLKILYRQQNGDVFFHTPAGKSLIQSAYDDLALEGLTKESFQMQKSNRWQLQGKSFYKIFSEAFDPNAYPFIYGILSESIHSSWTKSLDWDLIRNNDNTFSSNALYYKGDVRNLLPLIPNTIRPYELWCEKYPILDSSSQQIFDRIKKYSILIYTKFEEFYDGSTNESNYPNTEGKETSSQKKSSGEYEISEILSKYDSNYLRQLLDSKETEENTLTLTFYRDVAEILDILTRLRNFERNPTGFSLDDATILGLLVNIWKLLKLTILIYKEESAEFAPIPERVLFENAITAIYLLRSDKTILEDFRLCSYRNRIKMLELLATSETENFNNKAGKRLLRSIKNKLALEGLENYDFEKQIKNNWRIQGKTFYEIFKEVVGAEHYPVIYGIPSDSVHGTWLDVKQFSLDGNPKQGFLPIYKPLNMSFENVSLIVPLATRPFREWIARVKLETTYINEVLDFIDSINGRLFEKYGKKLIYHKSA